MSTGEEEEDVTCIHSCLAIKGEKARSVRLFCVGWGGSLPGGRDMKGGKRSC